MAYMSQEKKASLAPAIKAILKKYGLNGTLSVDHHSTLVLTIKSGAIDFCEGRDTDHIQINVYHIDRHYTGTAQEALSKLRDAMNVGNHDKSDLMSDYHDVGWYVSINVGRWNVPYVYVKKGA